jgi:hypothetical protein
MSLTLITLLRIQSETFMPSGLGPSSSEKLTKHLERVLKQ